MQSTQMYGFPKDERFRVPKFQSPPPGNYDPRQALNQNFNSTYKYMGSTKFGHEPQNSLEGMWKLDTQKAQPGPGAYVAFSEFAGPQ